MAAATTSRSVFPAIFSLPSTAFEPHKPITSLHSPNFFKPIRPSEKIPNPNPLRLCASRAVEPKHAYKALAVSGLVDGSSGTSPDSESDDSTTGTTFGIKPTRRTLLVQFTCNACGETTQRLINPLAYERGLVYVQCAGCLQHHKLVDNLGIVVEYNFQEDAVVDQEGD